MFVDRSELFQDLSEDFTDAVAAALVEEDLKAGQDLFRQGEAARRLYFLDRGRIRLTVGTASSVTKTVRREGEVFGWSSLVGQGTYTATARCLTDVRVLRIEGRQLTEILERYPADGLIFFRRLARVIRRRLIDSYRILLTYDSEMTPHSYG